MGWRETKVVFKSTSVFKLFGRTAVEEKQKLYLNRTTYCCPPWTLSSWRETKVVFKYIYAVTVVAHSISWRETKVVFKYLKPLSLKLGKRVEEKQKLYLNK